jgi:hypothetical protein
LLVGLGGVLLARNLDVWPAGGARFLGPGPLVLLGAWLIAGGRRLTPSPSPGNNDEDATGSGRTAVLGGFELASQAGGLRVGDLTAIFGGIEIRS